MPCVIDTTKKMVSGVLSTRKTPDLDQIEVCTGGLTGIAPA